MRGMNRILLKVKHRQLKAARGKWRPTDLARELKLTPQAFANYENGLNRVPAPVLIRWCELLSLQPISIIVEEDKKMIEALAST
jgi:transcriptional regulator with XRE-family HTH domain